MPSTDVGQHHLPPSLRGCNLDPGLRRPRDDLQRRPSSSSTRTSASVIVNCSPRNLDALAGQPLGPGVDPAALHHRIGEVLEQRGLQLLHAVGQLQHQRQGPARQHRRAPQQRELPGRRLLDLQVGRARFMRHRCAGRRQASDSQATQASGRDDGIRALHGSVLARRTRPAGTPRSAACPAAPAAAPCISHASRRRPCARPAAFCSPSHAVFTSAAISSKCGERPGTIESTKTKCQPKPDSIGPCQLPGAARTAPARTPGRTPWRSLGGAVTVVVLEHERITDRLARSGIPGRRAVASAFAASSRAAAPRRSGEK